MGPASGPGDEAGPELAIIHYWSIVHSLSTNGLARLCGPVPPAPAEPAPATVTPAPGPGLEHCLRVTRAHSSPGNPPLTSEQGGSQLCVSLVGPAQVIV